MRYEPVIGLEIHAQLQTSTKIFCGCSTTFDAAPNTHVCPVCLGLPGALPVLNRAAVDDGIRAALALGCKVQPSSVFARKNYFYPDLPKGYQISQYELPLATGGVVDFENGGASTRVGIVRIHLEEDAGKSLHDGFADSERKTYVDFNRSGVPLIEIVTEPDLRSAADAAKFFTHLRAILVWLGVTDGNMEEGSLRCDANVSVRPAGSSTLGTKAEVKNLNSFRFLDKALAYEIDRQIDVLEGGGRVVQETRLFDAASGHTIAMRSKEEANDYRYFPDPDLPAVSISAERVARLLAAMPELPDARRRRFVEQYAIAPADALQLTQTRASADYFERAIGAGAVPKLASNWIRGELARKLKELRVDPSASPLSAERLAELLQLIERGVLSQSIAKEVFEKMLESGRAAEEIVAADGLAQMNDESEIDQLIADVLLKNETVVEQYRGGKAAAFGYLVGQVLKTAKGKANPTRVKALLEKVIGRAS